MKTIASALKDEIHYPVSAGFIENRLMIRGLDAEGIAEPDVLRSNEFQGAVADCLVSLVEAPDIAEDEVKITLQNREAILKRANRIYAAIGEEPADFRPKVYIGGRHHHNHKH